MPPLKLRAARLTASPCRSQLVAAYQLLGTVSLLLLSFPTETTSPVAIRARGQVYELLNPVLLIAAVLGPVPLLGGVPPTPPPRARGGDAVPIRPPQPGPAHPARPHPAAADKNTHGL